MGGLWGLAFLLSGMRETVAYLQAEAEANWLHKHQPEIWAQTHKFMYLSGYLTYRLTGRYIDSVGSQVGYMPFDYKALRWAGKFDWKWQAVPMDASHPGRAGAARQPTGRDHPRGRRSDRHPRRAAADRRRRGQSLRGDRLGLPGTAHRLPELRHHRHLLHHPPEIHRAHPAHPALPGGGARRLLHGIPDLPRLLDGELVQARVRPSTRCSIAEERGIEPEELFDELVGQVPPGSMGLVLQPYWSPGLKVPGPEAKGAVIGFGDVHTRAHLYRAILEGLAYALREGKERQEKRSHAPVTELRVSGGGSQSDAAMQLTADIFGLPAARPHLYETAGLGAAIDAAVGLGLHAGFPQAVQAMTRVARVFEPDPDNHAIYDGLYTQVYQQMYARLRPLYERIREITGYPGKL